jgi:hypothetical protein
VLAQAKETMGAAAKLQMQAHFRLAVVGARALSVALRQDQLLERGVLARSLVLLEQRHITLAVVGVGVELAQQEALVALVVGVLGH